MLDAALFEIDGALADTRAARRASLIRSLADDGIVIHDRDEDERFAALEVAEAARRAARRCGRAYDETDAELAARRAARYFGAWLGGGLTLLPGARELVESFAGRVRLAIVTRATRREAEIMVEMAELSDAFDCIVASDDRLAPRPSPAMHAAALARLARRSPVNPARAMAFEATGAGIRAARRAGVRCVAVGGLAAHEAIEADALVTSYAGDGAAVIARLIGERERAT